MCTWIFAVHVLAWAVMSKHIQSRVCAGNVLRHYIESRIVGHLVWLLPLLSVDSLEGVRQPSPPLDLTRCNI